MSDNTSGSKRCCNRETCPFYQKYSKNRPQNQQRPGTPYMSANEGTSTQLLYIGQNFIGSPSGEIREFRDCESESDGPPTVPSLARSLHKAASSLQNADPVNYSSMLRQIISLSQKLLKHLEEQNRGSETIDKTQQWPPAEYKTAAGLVMSYGLPPVPAIMSQPQSRVRSRSSPQSQQQQLQTQPQLNAQDLQLQLQRQQQQQQQQQQQPEQQKQMQLTQQQMQQLQPLQLPPEQQKQMQLAQQQMLQTQLQPLQPEQQKQMQLAQQQMQQLQPLQLQPQQEQQQMLQPQQQMLQPQQQLQSQLSNMAAVGPISTIGTISTPGTTGAGGAGTSTGIQINGIPIDFRLLRIDPVHLTIPFTLHFQNASTALGPGTGTGTGDRFTQGYPSSGIEPIRTAMISTPPPPPASYPSSSAYNRLAPDQAQLNFPYSVGPQHDMYISQGKFPPIAMRPSTIGMVGQPPEATPSNLLKQKSAFSIHPTDEKSKQELAAAGMLDNLSVCSQGQVCPFGAEYIDPNDPKRLPFGIQGPSSTETDKKPLIPQSGVDDSSGCTNLYQFRTETSDPKGQMEKLQLQPQQEEQRMPSDEDAMDMKPQEAYIAQKPMEVDKAVQTERPSKLKARKLAEGQPTPLDAPETEEYSQTDSHRNYSYLSEHHRETHTTNEEEEEVNVKSPQDNPNSTTRSEEHWSASQYTNELAALNEMSLQNEQTENIVEKTIPTTSLQEELKLKPEELERLQKEQAEYEKLPPPLMRKNDKSAQVKMNSINYPTQYGRKPSPTQFKSTANVGGAFCCCYSAVTTTSVPTEYATPQLSVPMICCRSQARVKRHRKCCKCGRSVSASKTGIYEKVRTVKSTSIRIGQDDYYSAQSESENESNALRLAPKKARSNIPCKQSRTDAAGADFSSLSRECAIMKVLEQMMHVLVRMEATQRGIAMETTEEHTSAHTLFKSSRLEVLTEDGFVMETKSIIEEACIEEDEKCMKLLEDIGNELEHELNKPEQFINEQECYRQEMQPMECEERNSKTRFSLRSKGSQKSIEVTCRTKAQPGSMPQNMPIVVITFNPETGMPCCCVHTGPSSSSPARVMPIVEMQPCQPSQGLLESAKQEPELESKSFAPEIQGQVCPEGEICEGTELEIAERLRECQLREEELRESQKRECQILEDRLRESQMREEKIRESQMRESQILEDRLRESQTREEKMRESQKRASQILEDRLRESQTREEKMREIQKRESQILEDRLRESQMHEEEMRESQKRESQILEDRLRESQIREEKMRESQKRESQILEDRLRESQIREEKIRESQKRASQILEDRLRESQMREEEMRENLKRESEKRESQFLQDQKLREEEMRESQKRESEKRESQFLQDQKLREEELREEERLEKEKEMREEEMREDEMRDEETREDEMREEEMREEETREEEMREEEMRDEETREDEMREKRISERQRLQEEIRESQMRESQMRESQRLKERIRESQMRASQGRPRRETNQLELVVHAEMITRESQIILEQTEETDFPLPTADEDSECEAMCAETQTELLCAPSTLEKMSTDVMQRNSHDLLEELRQFREELCECSEEESAHSLRRSKSRPTKSRSGGDTSAECDCRHCRASREIQRKSFNGEVACTSHEDCKQQLKAIVDSIILDLESMEKVRRRHQKGDPPCNSNKLPIKGSTEAPPVHARQSFPVTILEVSELGLSSLYVKWVIHDCHGIGGYEIYVDGYLTNRYYNARHEAAVVCDVDVAQPHKVALIAKPKIEKALLGAGDIMEEYDRPPVTPSTWVPSIFLYEPSMNMDYCNKFR